MERIKYIQLKNLIEYNIDGKYFILIRIPKNKKFTGIKQLSWKTFKIGTISYFDIIATETLGITQFPIQELYRILKKRCLEKMQPNLIRLLVYLRKTYNT